MNNFKHNHRRRIGIDARFYGPLGKGLGRYVQEVVDNIVRLDCQGEFEYVVFLSPENINDFQSDNPLVTKRELSLRWYSWREQLFLPRALRKEKLDLVHFPHFNIPIFTSTPFVVTIHDLILTRFPSRRASMLPAAFYWFKQMAYRLVIRMAVLRAHTIITVSNFTRQDIIDKFGANPKKLIVTYEGVADLVKQESNPEAVMLPAQVLALYHISSPFLLYVGNAYPHKNLNQLMVAFSELHRRRPELSLVMVGKNDYFYQRVRAKAESLQLWQDGAENTPVVLPGYIPDAHLASLYQQALLYIFPSLYEGFGLPPLEAMAHGCPVVSSNQASLPEIIGDAAEYFNPYDEQDIIAKIESLIDDSKRRQTLVARGLVHVKKFSWQACAEQTLAIYRQAVK